MNSDLIIEPPKCDWVYLLRVDKRKKATWHCKACKVWKAGMSEPGCACKRHVIPDPSTTATPTGAPA